MKTFQSLGLSENILENLKSIGFETPTPVQEKTIPVLLENSCDLIAQAQTGTGKTAAFGLPLLDLIEVNQGRNPQALILSPTRELGLQIAEQLKLLSGKRLEKEIQVVYGGAPITKQMRDLKSKPSIIVATPGRLMDLMRRRAVNLNELKYLILDEADEMLSMGFLDDIDYIFQESPDEKNTWLFSATMPKEIRTIIKRYMHDPVDVQVNKINKTNQDIEHLYVQVTSSNKLPALRRFLDLDPSMRGVMFCRTKRETQEIADTLTNEGYGVEPLHGDLSQSAREQAMSRFKARNMQLLIATDVAARGIDVDNLSHVIHHKLPTQTEIYTHRSGRTGRAGKKGISLVFVNSKEMRQIKAIEKDLQVTFKQAMIPEFDEVVGNRLKLWTQEVISTDPQGHNAELFHQALEEFKELSKEDLIERMVQMKFGDVQSKSKEGNLNDTGAKRDESRKGYTRFFVNLGKIDGIDAPDVVDILAEVSQCPAKSIQDLKFLKNCTFFNVEDKYANGFGQKFDGVQIGGRDLRVNRDNDDNAGSRKSKDGFKSKSRSRSGGGRKPRREGQGGSGGPRGKSSPRKRTSSKRRY